MHSVDGDSECFRIHLDIRSAGIADHITFANLADILDGDYLPFESQALLDAGGVRCPGDKRNAVP